MRDDAVCCPSPHRGKPEANPTGPPTIISKLHPNDRTGFAAVSSCGPLVGRCFPRFCLAFAKDPCYRYPNSAAQKQSGQRPLFLWPPGFLAAGDGRLPGKAGSCRTGARYETKSAPRSPGDVFPAGPCGVLVGWRYITPVGQEGADGPADRHGRWRCSGRWARIVTASKRGSERSAKGPYRLRVSSCSSWSGRACEAVPCCVFFWIGPLVR